MMSLIAVCLIVVGAFGSDTDPVFGIKIQYPGAVHFDDSGSTASIKHAGANITIEASGLDVTGDTLTVGGWDIMANMMTLLKYMCADKCASAGDSGATCGGVTAPGTLTCNCSSTYQETDGVCEPPPPPIITYTMTLSANFEVQIAVGGDSAPSLTIPSGATFDTVSESPGDDEETWITLENGADAFSNRAYDIRNVPADHHLLTDHVFFKSIISAESGTYTIETSGSVSFLWCTNYGENPSSVSFGQSVLDATVLEGTQISCNSVYDYYETRILP